MLKRSGGGIWFMWAPLALCATAASAQQPNRADAAIEQIRSRRDLSPTDTRQIGDWVAGKVQSLEQNAKSGNPNPLGAFRKQLTDQFSNSKNTSDF